MTVWNLGSINIDHVYVLEHLPGPGETIASSGYSQGLGGKGANQSVAAARAGARVVHLGAIGAGDTWVIERMAGYGVETREIARLSDTPSGHAIILVDTGAENSIVLHPGANRALADIDLERSLAGIEAGDILLLQNETSDQVRAAKAARAAGATVIYSAAPFDPDAIQAVLPHTDIIALNEGEAAALAEAMPGRLPVAGMLITRGAAGAEFHDLQTGQVQHQPAFAVTAVDTTGAGDCFAGNFAALLNETGDIALALRFASAAAAVQVTRPGAGDAMPSRTETEAFMKDRA